VHSASQEITTLSQTYHPSVTLSPQLNTYLADLLSATLHHPHLASHITPRTRVDLVDLTKAARLVFRPFLEAGDGEGAWASSEDVRRVWVGCLKGRVGMRTGNVGKGKKRRGGRGEVMGVLGRVGADDAAVDDDEGEGGEEEVVGQLSAGSRTTGRRSLTRKGNRSGVGSDDEGDEAEWERLEVERVLLEILEVV
jgi:hypothetical protein